MRRAATASALLLVATLASAAATVKIAGPAPDTVPAAVRALLANDGLAIELDGRPVADFWLRRVFALKAGAPERADVALRGVESGTLLGVVRFASAWKDYRGNVVASGVYTLRYGLRPEDGNHMGVSIHRDFALLVPAALDPGPGAKPSAEALNDLARKASGIAHPAVMSLFPLETGATVPSIVENEAGQPMLAADVGGLRAGFVVEGEGEH